LGFLDQIYHFLAAVDTIDVSIVKGDGILKKLNQVDDFHMLPYKEIVEGYSCTFLSEEEFQSAEEVKYSLTHMFEEKWLSVEHRCLDWEFGEYNGPDTTKQFKLSNLDVLYRWLKFEYEEEEPVNFQEVGESVID
jgi:hypothetical protein